MLAMVAALLAPPRCAACGSAGRDARAVLCASCRRGLPWLPVRCCRRCALPLPHARGHCPARDAAFDAAWSAVAYEGGAREAMHALKFGAARPLAGVMAAQIAATAPARLLTPGKRVDLAIVPVAAHPHRRRARGFDPAELIAVALARRTGVPLRRVLRRGRAPSHQLGASRETRRDAANLHFFARAAPPPRIVLVDDVHTTGATLHACAQALRDAGAEHVVAVTWARTLDDRSR